MRNCYRSMFKQDCLETNEETRLHVNFTSNIDLTQSLTITKGDTWLQVHFKSTLIG